MTREQRLVALAVVVAVLAIVWVLLATFILVLLVSSVPADATPPYHPTPLSERMFADVPAPRSADVSFDVTPAGASHDPGHRPSGASEHRTGAPLPARVAVPFSAPAPQSADAAVGDAAQTPPTAQPSAAIRKEVGAQPVRFVTWYADPSLGPDGLYAAAGDWTWGDDPYLVVLTRIADGRTYSVTLIVQDACSACRDGSPILDVSPAAFMSLGVPLSAGVVRVEVTRP